MAEKLMPKRTFASINGGKAYIVDEDAAKRYAIGGRNIFGVYENSECEDLQQLMKETREYLKARSTPQVTYEADVVDLASMGREWEGVGVGDEVDIIDTCFSPTLRCRGRVTKIVRNVLADTATVTLGNVTDTLSDAFARQIDREKSLQDTINKLASENEQRDDSDYLEKLIDDLNDRFDENGANYYHMDFETGSTWSSVPLEDDGQPTRDGGWAINIGSLGFRIASKRRADGSWDWSTFGTGEGFTANSIVSGSLDARLIRAGVLTDRAGKNYWNLDTGKMYTRNMRADDASFYDASAWNLNAFEHFTVSSGERQVDIYDGRIDARLGGESFGYIQLADKTKGNGIRLVANKALSLYAPHVYMGVTDEWHPPIEGVTTSATFVTWVDFGRQTYTTKQIYCQNGVVTSLS